MTPITDPLVGRTIAQYEILSRVGGGAMGVVYLARDTRLGRQVALKFLPQPWSHDETAKQRFVREAQAASATNHPNICTIHDIETADDGQLFIVMAFYEGPTLKQRIERGRVPVDEALDVASQIADGLAKAHAQGVVHRDVKPGNVILTEEGVRILDFGLATFVDALKLTAENASFGTPAYMSPEQVRGQAADARSDVWAVGVVLYEMLAGHVPFQGSHVEAIAHAVRHEAPAPLRAARPEISEDVEQLVFRALHKDPSVRFPHGRALARALRHVRGQTVPVDLRTEPVAVEPSAATRVDGRRGRWMSWAAVAATLALCGAGVAAWAVWPVERTVVAVAPFGNQTGDPDLDQYRLALTQTLTRSLGEVRNLRVVPYVRTLEVVRRFLQTGADVSDRDAIRAITAETGPAMVVVPTLLRDGGAWRARVELRDAGTANNLWEHDTRPLTSSLTRDVAYQLADMVGVDVESHLLSDRSRLLRAVARLMPSGADPRADRPRSIDTAKAFADGIGWYEDLEYAQAKRAFRAAVDLDPRNPLLLAWWSRAAQLTRDDNEAIDAAERAVAVLTARTPRADASFAQAVAGEARRNPAEAETRYRELVAGDPGDPTWTMELAGFLDRQARYADAVGLYHDALRTDLRLIRPRLELCRLYSPSRLNEPAESRRFGQEALEAYRGLGARAGQAHSLLCLADTLAVGTANERSLAQAHARTAQSIFADFRYDYSEARAEYYLAIVAGMRGDFVESITLGERALTRAKAAGNVPIQATLMNNLGAAHVSSGNPLIGAEYYQQAYKLFQAWRDETRAARIQANRGALLIDYGNADEGLLDVRNALAVSERIGDSNFQSFCLRVIATYHLNRGRHREAIRQLNTALAIARERNLADNVTVTTTLLALSQFETADYGAAQGALLQVLKAGSGRRSLEARIRLARTYVRLGDFVAAQQELAIADRELAGSPNPNLRALLFLVRGERALELRQLQEARRHFKEASETWMDQSPEPSVIEARAYNGLLEARAGRAAEGRKMIRGSVDAASRLGHSTLVARCQLLLAELEIAQGRMNDARGALAALPQDDDERTLGQELRAQIIDVQGRLQAMVGDADASGDSRRRAEALIREVIARLPEGYRVSYLRRESLPQLGHPAQPAVR